MRIGLISDTHGRWLPRVESEFAGVDLILHAGDIGDPSILSLLGEIAPVYAVRGNCDSSSLFAKIPEILTIEGGAIIMGLLHGHQLDPSRMDEDAIALFRPRGATLIVHGHTHITKHAVYDGITIVNPGAIHQYSRGNESTVALVEFSTPEDITVTFRRISGRDTPPSHPQSWP